MQLALFALSDMLDTARVYRTTAKKLIADRAAAHAGVVAMNGAGFDGPPWSIRLSPADLDEADYRTIGRAVRSVGVEYLAQWRAAGR